MEHATPRPALRMRQWWIATAPALAVSTAILVVVAARGQGRDAEAVRKAVEAGRPDVAEAPLHRWLQSSPRSAEAQYYLARVAGAVGDRETATHGMATAQSLGLDAARSACLFGLFLARDGRPAEAEPYLRRAFDDLKGPDPELAEALARAYLGSFRLERARSVLERWARESPDDGRPYLLLTEVGTRTGDDAQAVLAYYREALRRDPSLAPAHLGLADLLRSMHQYNDAADEYDRYLALRPKDPMGYLGAGLNAVARGEPGRASEWLDRALQLAPTDPAILSALAEREIAANRLDRALDYCDRSVRSDPFDTQVRYRRMLVLNRLGRSDEARKERQAIDRLRAERAEFDQIGAALVRSPTDPDLRARAAAWLMAHGRESEAIDWARLVLTARPDHPEMNRLLADHYRKCGQPGLANHYEALASPIASGSARTP